MQFKRISVSKVNPAPYNPRKDLRPEDPEYQRLLRSIEEFGCVEPLVWNSRTGLLVGGHQRFKVLLSRGATEVDVSVVDLPSDKEKALNLALNKIRGDWDEDKLSALLAELSAVPDFEIGLTGFDSPEIEGLLAGLTGAVAGPESFNVNDALEDGLPPITQPGDLIVLGNHRLLCGDASKPADVARVLQGADVQLLCSDPPYNVDYQASRRPKAKEKRCDTPQWTSIRNDALSPGRYAAWFKKVIGSVEPHLAPGSAFYLWNGHANFALMHSLLCERELTPSCVITWVKEHFAPGFGDYQQQTEFCLYGWKRGGKHRWYGGKAQSTAWEVPRDRSGHYQHPTQKSLELFERIIRNSSCTGDVVFDPFLGSGTTLVAAARLGRACHGLEIEPKYCDVIVRRFIAAAGRQAISEDVATRYCTPIQEPAA